MDASLKPILKSIYDALENVKASRTCRSIGELQVVLRHNIDAYGDYLQPLHNFVTATFIQSRYDFVDSLSESEFLSLARKIEPCLFEGHLVNDCDVDGSPVYEGKMESPVIAEGNVTSKARRMFVERAGIKLVDLAPINDDAVANVEFILTTLLNEHGQAIYDSYAAAREKLSSQAPMTMRIPRM
jgi:hypothetical protein